MPLFAQHAANSGSGECRNKLVPALLYPALIGLVTLFLACAGTKTTTVTPPPTTVEEGLFGDIIHSGARKGQKLKITYQKGMWLPVGEATLVDIGPDVEEIDGAGSFAGKSARVYLKVKDAGNGRVELQFKISGAVQSGLEGDAAYEKVPGQLTVNAEVAIVRQTRYERKCDFLGCSGPGMELYVKELPDPQSGFAGAEHLLRFEPLN